MKKHRIFKKRLHAVTGLVIAGIVGSCGALLIGQSKAATTNPYGHADYCALEGNRTVIYGWAADPQATSLPAPNVTVRAGSAAVTVPTDRNYRASQVNAYIDGSKTGDPKPGTYGYRAAFDGLYKGGNYAVSGTIINVGSGTDIALPVNDDHYIDNDNSKHYFAGRVIPQVCLAVRPASPPPPPPASPQPSPPAPQPAQPSPAPSPRPSPGSPPPAAPAQAAPPSAEANGGVVAGTVAASVTIPVGNAAKVHVLYGTDEANLTRSDEKDTNNADVQLLLKGLKPAAEYSYQLVRTNSTGQTATSPFAKFTTAGFTVTLRFVNEASKDIEDVKASIKTTDHEGTSGKDGLVKFTDVKPGEYTVTYVYNNIARDFPIAANESGLPPEASEQTTQANLEYYINVETATVTKKTADSSGKNPLGLWILIGAGLLLAAVVAVLLIRRRRRSAGQYDDYTDPADTLLPPDVPPPVVTAPQQPLPKHGPRNVPMPPVDVAAHTGLSLKQMVIQSLAEDARRQQAEKQQDNSSGPDTPR